ncbi:DUF421 domain-containing protein [Rufibacter roseus]|uniref:DUF421 domain-containing protein n=1 Tax=Rufibacter roseus TaxID=1567108 RepID=A0ABW2DPL0_9BACT|nr:YetF domain-containing protein [Rufibacter roseus]
MKKEEIYLGDWQRLLFGNAPAEFMLEVLLRSLVIFAVLLVVLRLLGKRMNAQLTISELAVMLTLGAIVAVPMQIPERGILQGIIILVCALVFQRGLTWLTVKSRKAEMITHGHHSIIVRNGVLQIEEMEKSHLSKEQVFSALRTHNIMHLGQVKRLYMEACGLFSVIRQPDSKPGLSVLPIKDKNLLEAQSHAQEKIACVRCGTLLENINQDKHSCPTCSCDEWVPAVTDKK